MNSAASEENPEVIVACFATKRTSGAQNMINSLRKWGWIFEILGLGAEWTGWNGRMRAYLDFAKKKHPDVIIVFVDCYDALAVRDPTGFLDLFRDFGADIVVGTNL